MHLIKPIFDWMVEMKTTFFITLMKMPMKPVEVFDKNGNFVFQFNWTKGTSPSLQSLWNEEVEFDYDDHSTRIKFLKLSLENLFVQLNKNQSFVKRRNNEYC